MAKPKTIKSRGSGWHKQSLRHSRARKYGKAGGTYLTILTKEDLYTIKQNQKDYIKFKKELIKKNPTLTNKKIDELLQKNPTLLWQLDTDKDGTPDIIDCEPLNPKKQDKKNEPIKIKITKKTLTKAKNQLEKDLQKEIEKTNEPHKKATLKHIQKELQQADTHNKLQRFIKDYGYAISTLGMAIPFALISPLLIAGVILGTGLTGDVPIRAFIPRIAVPTTTTILGTEATRHSIKTIKAIKKAKKQIYQKTLQELKKDTKLPPKEAKKIAKKVAEQEISNKKITHEII